MPLPNFLKWAFDPSAIKREPDASKRAQGWIAKDKPSAGNVNWFWGQVSDAFELIGGYIFDTGVIEAWRIRPSLEPGTSAPDYKVIIGGTATDPRDGGAGDTAVTVQGGAAPADRSVEINVGPLTALKLDGAGDVSLLALGAQGFTAAAGGFDIRTQTGGITVANTFDSVTSGSGHLLASEPIASTGEGFIFLQTDRTTYPRDQADTNVVGMIEHFLSPVIGTPITQIAGPAPAFFDTSSGVALIKVTTTGSYKFRLEVPAPIPYSGGLLSHRGYRAENVTVQSSANTAISSANFITFKFRSDTRTIDGAETAGFPIQGAPSPLRASGGSEDIYDRRGTTIGREQRVTQSIEITISIQNITHKIGFELIELKTFSDRVG